MFSFTKVEERNGPYGNKVYVKVRTNAAYSHLHDTALAGAMLREFVAWDRSQEGRRALEEEDKILAYMLGVKLFDAWSGQSGSSAYGGYQKKFGLGRDLPLWEIASKIDHDRGVTQETIDYVKRKLHEPSPS